MEEPHPDQVARNNMLYNSKTFHKIEEATRLLNQLKDIEAELGSSSIKVRMKILSPDAIKPTKTNLSDAGWDLYALQDYTIKAGQRRTIKTGISFQIPEGWVGLIWPRSGLSVKRGLDILAGVIDAGYRGEIMVCLNNTNVGMPLFRDDDIDVEIKKGDRIAQILFQQVPEINMVEVNDLTSSDRGDKGFGSSGS